MKTICWTVLLAIILCGSACAEVVAPRYDLRVRLQSGEAHLVNHSGKIVGTMVVSRRKIVSSVNETASYQLRVLESREKGSKVRLTFGADNTTGTRSGVTIYAPFWAAIKEPTNQAFNGDAIRGQSADVEIAPNGDVAPDFSEPSLSLLKKIYTAKTSLEKERVRREIVAFEIKRQIIEKFRWFIGVRPTKPVAIGESWRGAILLRIGYLERRVPVLYKLAKTENNVAFVTMRVNERPEKMVRVSMPKNMQDNSWNVQSGTMQIDLKSGWPLRAQNNGQSFSQLQTVQKKGAHSQTLLTTYGKSLSQVETMPLASFRAP